MFINKSIDFKDHKTWWSQPWDSKQHDENIYPYPNQLNRACTDIAQRTRRGCGNTIYIHPNLYNTEFGLSLYDYCMSYNIGEYLNNKTTPNIIITDACPIDHIVVAYQSNLADGSVIYVEDKKLLYFLEDDDNLAHWHNYVRKIKIYFEK